MTVFTSYSVQTDDVLFFRDGRPFSQGESSHLKSIFPPFPTVIYGAVRTALLFQSCDNQVLIDGVSIEAKTNLINFITGEGDNILQIRGPWLMRSHKDSEVLFPVPSDLAGIPKNLVKPNGNDSSDNKADDINTGDQNIRYTEIVRLKRIKADEFQFIRSGSAGNNLKLPELMVHEKPYGKGCLEPEALTGHFITLKGLMKWQKDETIELDEIVSPSELWVNEPRTGIAIKTESRNTENGMLYSINCIRLKDNVNLAFEVNRIEMTDGTIIRLGGEGKTALLEKQNNAFLPVIDNNATSNKLFALSFLSPAIFDNGPFPKAINRKTLEGLISDVKIKIIAASIGKFVNIGGWDMALKRPKPLRRAVPAGSVFYCECLEGDWKKLNGINLSDFMPEQGFGTIVVGGLK